jgi:hypothetical protein
VSARATGPATGPATGSATGPGSDAGSNTGAGLEDGLSALLLDSLQALAAAGEVEAACRLAGRACVMLRHCDPRLARRFDVLLHRMTPKLSW